MTIQTESPDPRTCAVCNFKPIFGLLAPPLIHYDHDLNGYVCGDCARRLVRAAAWLKHAGIRGCDKRRAER